MESQPLPALNFAFLKRTAIATLITALLVGLFAAVYYSPAWAGRYLIFALWSLTFFILTAFIFKAMAFSRDRILGFSLILAKLALLVGIFFIMMAWPIPEGEAHRPQALAMFLGISTPLFVLVLRVIGFMSELAKKAKPNKKSTPEQPNGNPPSGELRPHP